MNYIGIDNGVTGSIGIITDDDYFFHHTPTFVEQSYTKKKQNITRITVDLLKSLLQYYCSFETKCFIERPMVNSARFKASMSAMRALEATLIVLEELNISFQYIDSKQWQKELLPGGLKGSAEQKKASLDIANRLFPKYKDVYKKDGDGILITEYCRRYFR